MSNVKVEVRVEFRKEFRGRKGKSGEEGRIVLQDELLRPVELLSVDCPVTERALIPT